MMEYFYTIEKLTNALQSLALGEEDIRYRLVDACIEINTLEENDFPEDLKKKWIDFKNGTTKKGPFFLAIDGRQTKTAEENTLINGRKKTAKVLATKLFELYWEVSENRQYQ